MYKKYILINAHYPPQLTCSLSHNPRKFRQSEWYCGWRTSPVILCSPGCSPVESPLPTLREAMEELVFPQVSTFRRCWELSPAVDTRQFSCLPLPGNKATIGTFVAYLWLPWAKWHSTWGSVCLGGLGRQSYESVAQIPCPTYDLPRLEPEWWIRGRGVL